MNFCPMVAIPILERIYSLVSYSKKKDKKKYFSFKFHSIFSHTEHYECLGKSIKFALFSILPTRSYFPNQNSFTFKATSKKKKKKQAPSK